MSVTAAKGFAAAGVAAGIRPSGKPDVALVRSLVPAVGARCGRRTACRPRPSSSRGAISSRRSRRRSSSTRASRTRRPARPARRTPSRPPSTSRALLGLAPEEVLVLSTGVIGPRLPMEKLRAGVDDAAAALSPDGGDAAAEAILTTDAGPKTAVVERDGFTVGGMAKGAGMIHPASRRCSWS